MVGCFFCAHFSAPAVRSQEMPYRAYVFVEAKDTAGRAVSDATVSLSDPPDPSRDNARTGLATPFFDQNTDGEGNARLTFFPPGLGPYQLRVTKSGYVPSEHILFLYPTSEGYYALTYAVEDFPETQPDKKGPPRPITVTLTKLPLTNKERQLLEAEERKHKLISAAKLGDAATLKSLLDAGVNANLKDEKGAPVIVWAALSGNPESIEYLLDAGANVRDPGNLAHQALLVYLSEGLAREQSRVQSLDLARNQEIVQRLINAGAGVTVKSEYRGTVLNNAVSHRLPLTAVALILKAGADVNGAAPNGVTPLMIASANESTEIVKFLLEAGARATVNSADDRGRTALMRVPQYRSSSKTIAELLIAAGANVNSTDKDGKSALMIATQTASVEVIRALVNAKADVNLKDKEGSTALIFAAQTFSVEAVEVLIKAGARIDEPDDKGWTPLMRASARYLNDSGADVVKLLLDAGANIHAVNKEGQTALMLAARWYDEAAIKHLIAAGASLKATDSKGQTVLMHAFQSTSSINLKLLFDAGARETVNVKDQRGSTALMYSTGKYYAAEYATQLLAAGATINDVNSEGQSALMLAAQNGSEETVKALLARGADATIKDKKGMTTLMYVQPRYFHDEVGAMITALIGGGARLEEVDDDGRTALIVAANDRSPMKLKALIDAGASLDARDKNGRTALITAVESADSRLEKADYLVNAGADTTIRNNNGETALTIAQRIGELKIVRLIERRK